MGRTDYNKVYKQSLQTFIPIFIPFINRFIKIYSNIYDKNFPLLETEVKLKTLWTPWMSKAMRETSKKQKLHIKLLKSKSPARRRIYKQKLQKHLRKLKEII